MWLIAALLYFGAPDFVWAPMIIGVALYKERMR